jgi:hypothetical protein
MCSDLYDYSVFICFSVRSFVRSFVCLFVSFSFFLGLQINLVMPSVDSNSSYSSSGSSTSSLSSPRVLPTDITQQQPQQQPKQQQPAITSHYHHHHHRPMKTATTNASAITQSHVCVTRYKTELCRPFTEMGKCKYGDKCQFSHGMKELRVLMRHPKYKTEYCRTFHTSKYTMISLRCIRFDLFIAGYCPYGPRCHFIHDTHEARLTTNNNDAPSRRHSDLRTNLSLPKSHTR